MEIRDKSLYDSAALGSFAAEREKILKEEESGLKKFDTFKSGGEESMRVMGSDAADMKRILDAFNAEKKPLPHSSLELDGHLIPANTGKIKHMCLTSGNLGGIKENYINAFKTFVTKMPQAKFTVLTSTRTDQRELQDLVSGWKEEGILKNPERINVVDSGYNYSIWAQDSALVVGNKLVEQDRKWFPGGGDSMTAQEIARVNPEIDYKRLEGIFIDGGNHLATQDKVFVGTDAIAFASSDMKKYPAKYEKITADMGIKTDETMQPEDLAKLMMDKAFPHQKMTIVGYQGRQPAFHIDMAITPLGKPDPETGKPVMLVGDPSMAIGILEDIKTESPGKYERYEKEVASKTGGYPQNPLDYMVENLKDDTSLQENFDALAKGFEKEGYKVDRVPYLGSSQLRGAPWITYNNAVIDGDNVFIPNFAIPELDDVGNGTYKKYGYNPQPIDMTAISSLQGAINCITKVVEREYA
jgi:hypothetical protein